MSVAIGYVPGAFGQGGDNPDFLKDLVDLGDRYEYDSIWLSDRIVSDSFNLEPIVALSMIAAYSERMKFGTSVLALPLRNPVILAKQIATLDYLSKGRFFPAVGLGQEDPGEYEACGVPKGDRGRRTDEAIRLMRMLWEEDNVTYEGEFFTCHDGSISPKTYLKPSPPVWIGGRSMAAARRVGGVGDGWLVSSATTQEVSLGRNVVFDTADKADREKELEKKKKGETDKPNKVGSALKKPFTGFFDTIKTFFGNIYLLHFVYRRFLPFFSLFLILVFYYKFHDEANLQCVEMKF